jgi:hypothetical protein
VRAHFPAYEGPHHVPQGDVFGGKLEIHRW